VTVRMDSRPTRAWRLTEWSGTREHGKAQEMRAKGGSFRFAYIADLARALGLGDT
jgi:hypothetical protein